MKAGLDALEFEVRSGTREDALWDAIGSNQEHDAAGKRRTNADKRRAVEMALRHQNAGRMSNVDIASHCGVGESYVRKLKPIFAQSEDTSERTVTRNGTTYTMAVGNIGHKSTSQPPIQEQPQPPEPPRVEPPKPPEPPRNLFHCPMCSDEFDIERDGQTHQREPSRTFASLLKETCINGRPCEQADSLGTVVRRASSMRTRRLADVDAQFGGLLNLDVGA